MSHGNRELVSRLAFVGNLPPDATPEEMKELCSQVGEAVMFRIVFDRETGKPKGYGFCEYRDAKLVDAAVDLLHGFEVKGQKLYVRRADQEKQSMSQNNSNNNTQKKNKKKKQSSSKRKAVDEISRVVSSFSTNEKREILSQMKLLIEQNENGAKRILLENPQLAQALLLIQMEFNLVAAQDISALITPVENSVAVTQEQTPHQQSQSVSQLPPPPQPQPQQQLPLQPPLNNNNNNNNNDVVMNTAAPSSSNTNINQSRMANLNNQQKTILSKVLTMTPEQIANLPDHVQKQVRAVQEKLSKNNMMK